MLFVSIFSGAAAWATLNGALMGASAEFDALSLQGVPASIALGLLSALCLGAALFCLRLVWSGVTSKDKLVLGPDAIVIPSGRNVITIPYAEVRKLEPVSGFGFKSLFLFHRDKEISVDAHMLGNPWRYKRVVKTIEQRVKTARGPT